MSQSSTARSGVHSPSATLSWRSMLGGAAAGLLGGWLALSAWRAQQRRRERAAQAVRTAPPTRSEVIVLGCGSSTGVPRAACVTAEPITCDTCRLAMQGPAETNRNWRGNPSLLIRLVRPNAAVVNVQIDVCKTFLTSVLRWYPYYGVRTLDAVLLTHEHADAMLGVDDVRSLQRFEREENGVVRGPPRLPIFASAHTLRSVEKKFAYLMPPQPAPGPPLPNAVERKVAQIAWECMRSFRECSVEGVPVLPLPVLHGEDYICLAFLIGDWRRASTSKPQSNADGASSPRPQTLLYMSDVSRVPESTWHFLCTGQLPTPPATASPAEADAFYEQFSTAATHPTTAGEWRCLPSEPVHPNRDAGAPVVDLLIVDSLFPIFTHDTHFHLPHSLDFIQRLQPRRALLTGLSDLFEYERDNAELKRRRACGELTVDVELAYDGMRIALDV